MDTYTDLSLAIVTYNNEEKIVGTIRSIVNAIPSEVSYRIYIIDNGSKDNTISNLKKIKNKSIQIVTSDKNAGFGYGHNFILDRINSKFHIVINPDITIRDNKQLQMMIDYFNNHTIGMIVPNLLNDDGTTQYLLKNNPTVLDITIRFFGNKFFSKRQRKFVNMQTNYDEIINVQYASGAFMAFDTKIFIEIHGFDTRFFMYFEDADITRRVNQVSKAIFLPTMKVNHSWSRAGHKKVRYMIITFKSMVKYFNKWGWKLL
ncbi:glycosyltransferase family 2 protein [Dellaglioa algida]|uniref:glycosyltransferase family 2 protein n=1 Tax=Dellaglioa algida TaxID=105612 RepID=UPI0024C4E3C9|nr:glycosyltransferase family 2 protein [Dellaglioa algida]MDK1724762.1 glycosyltransferase family 2 protein [Dellaglioa algida]MDK1738698.1 glycosyltransferase family 2 protein [Dellaglioa algida]